MLTIDLYQHRKTSYKKFLGLILTSGDSRFELMIPRRTMYQHKDDRQHYFHIHFEFELFAWAAFKLHAISSFLDYDIPALLSKESLRCTIVVKEVPENFAKLLFELAGAFNPRGDEYVDFHLEGSQYHADHYEEKRTWASYRLYKISQRYLILFTDGGY